MHRAIGAVIPVISVPLALNHLGATGYGAWATAVALTTVFAFSDLGIGSGLMTRLGGAAADGEPSETERRIVSSAYAMVGCMVLAMEACLVGVSLFSDVGAAFAAPNDPRVELIVCLTLAGFIMSMWTSLVVRVQYAMGQQTRSNLWQTAGSLAMLAGIWLASRFSDGPGWFVVASAFTPVAVGAANSTWFFRFTRAGRAISPTRRSVDLSTSIELVRLGARYVVVSLLLALSVAADPWIVGHVASLSEVPNFAVPSRVFAGAGLVSVMALMPLWPVHARAVEDGDVVWIATITRRLTIGSTAAVGVVSATLVAISSPLVHFWLDDAIRVNYPLWIAFAVYCVAQASAGPMFMVQNGAGVLGPQTIGYVILLTTLPLKWWIGEYFDYRWIPWVSATAYLVIVIPAGLVGYRHAMRLAGARARDHAESG